MRLHKSETAFFVLIAVILAAGVLIFHAYDLLFSIANELAQSGRNGDIVYLSKLLFANRTCCLRRRCSSASSSSSR